MLIYFTDIHILACKQFLIHLPRQLAISLDVKHLSPSRETGSVSSVTSMFILVAHICSLFPSMYPFRAKRGKGTKLPDLNPSQ